MVVDLVEREWAYGRAIPEVEFGERVWLLWQRRGVDRAVCGRLMEAGSLALVAQIEALSDEQIATLNAAA